MTDWVLAARCRGVVASEQQVAAYAQTMTALEEAVAALKTQLPYDAEPATFIKPVEGDAV